jgi:hypothetical protein
MAGAMALSAYHQKASAKALSLDSLALARDDKILLVAVRLHGCTRDDKLVAGAEWQALNLISII